MIFLSRLKVSLVVAMIRVVYIFITYRVNDIVQSLARHYQTDHAKLFVGMADSKNNSSGTGDIPINEADLYLSFRLMKAGDFEGAETRIVSGLDKAKAQDNTQILGLYLSALGLLNKLRKDYKESYKCYQQS